MNRINPKKLIGSKWTAVVPQARQRHFAVVKVEFDEEGERVLACVIEAVLTRQQQGIDWEELKDEERWRFGWL
jgi:tryptophan-rich hypothetical protein